MKEKKNFKTNRKLLALVGFLSAAFIALNVTITVAAFINVNKNSVSVNYKTENIGTTYFDGGTGIQNDPYLIGTSAQLRSLQKLNSLGLFNSDTYFAMDADITWTSTEDPLLPIGSDDMPFNGTFDGKGHTITDLVIDGKQTWDVGMFGYVGITGTIKNFILVHPTINLGSNSDGGSADTTNPLDTYLRSAAENMPVPSKTGDSSCLSWTDGSNYSQLAGLPSTVSAEINGNVETFNVVYESSNEDLLAYSDGAWKTSAPTGADASDTTSMNAVMLTARVFATVNNKTMAYTLERYEINVLNSGVITSETTTISVSSTGAKTTVIRGAFKTLYPLDADNGTTDYHATNVGFFCGHLDGFASYLGLDGSTSRSNDANGIITVSGRSAKSNTCLIGRCRGDDVRDGTGSKRYGHTFDFTQSVTKKTYTAPTAYGTYANVKSSVATQTTNALALTRSYCDSTDTDTPNYLRIYPTATARDSVTVKKDDTNETQTVNCLTMKGPLSAAEYSDNAETSTRYFFEKFAINNGFWVYTKGSSSDLLNTIMGQNEFTLDFNITYQCDAKSNYSTRSNYWQVLYNAYNPDKKYKIPILGWTYDGSSLQNGYWYDLNDPYSYSSSSGYYANSASNYTPVKIIEDGNVHEATVSITKTTDSSSILNSIFQSIFTSDAWYPTFAIGAGKNNSLKLYSQKNTSGKSAAEWASTQGTDNADITINEGSQSGLSTGSSGGWFPTTYYQSFYRSSFSADSDLSIHIISFQAIFTNANGNISSAMSNVDYLYDSSSCTFNNTTDTTSSTYDAYSSWNRDSGVKIAFDVASALGSGSNSTYYFYRSGSGVSSPVHAAYSNSSYKPTNSDGYKQATIESA